MISLLLAMDRNHVIGVNNQLPWHLPKDLRFFKEKTTGNTIIMGRKTFESMGGALSNRKNIVLTKRTDVQYENVKIIHHIDKIKKWNMENPKEEYFIIGGANLFKQVMDIADRMYITLIDDSFTGDTFFPEFNKEDWIVSSEIKGEKDEKNPYDYYFIQYDRKV
ncbi:MULTISPECIES: dihydrofolate reductase [unclassified Oceanobacillus]|uniref:dihydrofolate reductase n=1 Tax=unclassified Oceanobacillus TaxID=2630292 RepID=UPI001BE7A280|nr:MULTISPECIES: dihydrofolate reductase [unclassified Oceanobacillus]MBT2598509.1 dihydrofolate reductase [Oceanobacillus sp. ISL-74]MBT2651427.1 dihydrofolate reductase [Oceanobacillus sp. ISL-73]